MMELDLYFVLVIDSKKNLVIDLNIWSAQWISNNFNLSNDVFVSSLAISCIDLFSKQNFNDKTF